MFCVKLWTLLFDCIVLLVVGISQDGFQGMADFFFIVWFDELFMDFLNGKLSCFPFHNLTSERAS